MRVLFVAGSDFTIHPNHRAHHLVAFLESCAIQVDTVSLRRYYSGPPSSSLWTRFSYGLRGHKNRRVELIRTANGSQLIIQRLPGRLDYVAQDIWACFHLSHFSGQSYDLCIFGNPDNVLIPWLLKKRGVVKTIVYDDWDYYYGFDNSRLVRQLIKLREKMCVSIADVVVSVGELLRELREKQGAKQAFAIPNGVNYQLFSSGQNKHAHPPTLVYMGKLAHEYGVDVSLRGFAKVLKSIPTARYLIVGYNEGRYSEYLRDLVKEWGISGSVTFAGKKRYDELPDLLSKADIGVALFRVNDLMKYTFPLKVVEYMAAGLAVVGTKIGETERLIVEAKGGEALDCSADAFADVVTDLLKDKPRLATYSQNAGKYARHFDWDLLFSRFFVDIGFPVTANVG